jgi:hypothetical protein
VSPTTAKATGRQAKRTTATALSMSEVGAPRKGATARRGGMKFTTPEGIDVEYGTVTPELAERWLEKNTRNRHESGALTAQYGRSMSKDKFLFTGDSVKLSPEGEILDGQHRLLACVKTGKPFDVLVVSNLPPERQHLVDAGRKRTTADMFAIRHITRGPQLSAGARTHLTWMHWIDTGGSIQPGVPEIDDHAVEILPSLLAGLQAADLIASKEHGLGSRKISPGSVIAAYVRALEVTDNPYVVGAWFTRLATGLGLKAGEPVRLLRQKLQSFTTAQWRLQLYFIIKTWNATFTGEGIRKLQEPPYGLSISHFTDLTRPLPDDYSREAEEYAEIMEQLDVKSP